MFDGAFQLYYPTDHGKTSVQENYVSAVQQGMQHWIVGIAEANLDDSFPGSLCSHAGSPHLDLHKMR